MIEQNLYDFIISQDSRYTRNPLSERKRFYRISAERKRQTIKVVERLLNQARDSFRADFLVRYEARLVSVAENNVVATPSVNEQVFLNLGRVKFAEKLLQAYYVFTRHSDLWSKLIIDNDEFFQTVSKRLGHTRKRSLTESEELFVQIVELLALIGPRALGGRDSKSTLKGLRFSVKRPKRAKETQFRRGYNDKGSRAPQQQVEARTVTRIYYDSLVEFSYFCKSFDRLVVKQLCWNEFKKQYSFSFELKAGWSWLDDEILGDVRSLQKGEQTFHLWCTDNSLDEETVAKELNQLLHRG